ncbi:efflux transporter outer membrane subunit [Ramlibacter sp. AW1]|uniref:Efflux transporter outer membrane subunit n=1 Tax=Ramlibacter aurantiacus TaxID=2801330 RepID=A0A937D6Q5_9BURK|nr:efflux transporter outer membrane subunit [Ramlibacter aurantiacus]MBL0421193.1 efflux transporter outer membrane subunit [Ramlibacter aurantiacus]
MKRLRLVALLLPLGLGACTPLRPPPIEPLPAFEAPPQWATPLPHGGRVADLQAWWRQLGDPVLTRLLERAQRESPSLDAALARLEQARAARRSAEAALLPTLDGSAALSRGNAQPPLPLATTAQVGVQAGWEIDLFGARRDRVDAAQARVRSAEAGWHEARVSVAAETAASYFRLRACEMLLGVAEADLRSRAETARLTQLSQQAGFTPPATAALARASRSEGEVRRAVQRAQCETERHALSALTGVPVAELRADLAERQVPVGAELFTVSALPAEVLAQRPDLYQAEQAIEAARAEIGSAWADQYPRVTLGGSINAGLVHLRGSTTDAQTWTLGPLAVSVPLFDAGRRAANLDGARARYDEAVAVYRGRARQAVSEVEQALVALESARTRSEAVRGAAQDFRTSFEATEARYRAGLASLVELEDARRSLLAAETALAELYRDLQLAWTRLYRSAGGAWQPGTGTPLAQRSGALQPGTSP